MARILVVDDEPDVAELVMLILAKAGHEMEGVHSGRAALARLETHAYDLVICDLVMPEVNGVAIFKAVQARPEPRPRVVFLSGYHDAGGYEDFLGATGALALPKPFDSTTLPQAIARALGSGG